MLREVNFWVEEDSRQRYYPSDQNAHSNADRKVNVAAPSAKKANKHLALRARGVSWAQRGLPGCWLRTAVPHRRASNDTIVETSRWCGVRMRSLTALGVLEPVSLEVFLRRAPLNRLLLLHRALRLCIEPLDQQLGVVSRDHLFGRPCPPFK